MLSQQVPSAWPGELSADVAIFDDSVLHSLPSESALEASVVREALRDALESRGDEALRRVSAIPRGSAFSEWRLFIRGLVDWLTEKPDAAGEAWKRLDAERRPGRIATTMMIASRSDLEQASPLSERQGGTEPSPSSAWDNFDAQQLYHAKLLRRVRFDRSALRIAETGLNIPEESRELLLGPRKIEWLRRFLAEYQDTEPDLAAALGQAALRRAFAQDFSDVFDDAVGAFPGPRHDPRGRLLSFFYYVGYESDPSAKRKAEQALDQYLNRDLPQNTALSEPLRGAIASQIHFNKAMVMMRPGQGGGLLDLMFDRQENTRGIRDHLLAAAKAAPGHRAVHKAHAEWIKSKLDDDWLTKPQRAQFETELADVMGRWSQGLPDEVEPRLWLVDHLLESERLDEARPHVEFLAASRQDDPRVRAMPWKWQLLESMRLCRRKAWLADVPARLNEAEALWPAWLPKQWLPYLKAAWMLRAGRKEEFAEARRRIGEETGLVRDSLTDACLMLGAAQQLRVPAADLKPLRAAVDGALSNIERLPVEDLIEAGAFFWDLHRTQLLYPAYRLHGKTIGKAFLARLEKNAKLVEDGIDDEVLQKAVLWGSENRFWSSRYSTNLPDFFSKRAVQRHPIFMAAKLNSLLKERYHWNLDKHRDLGPPLREAAASQRDAYYRRWFVQLADQLDDMLAEEAARFSGFPFGNLFGDGEDDEDDELNTDDSYFNDSDCDCAKCQAARKARKQDPSSDAAPY